MVELALPFAPLRGSNTTKTMPLPCPCWLPAAGGACLAFRTAARIEHHENDAASLPLLAAGGGWRFGDIGKACDLIPGRRAIDALPEAVVARTQIEDGAVIRIDGQPFPVTAAVFIAAELEGHVGVLESLATVAGAQNGAI